MSQPFFNSRPGKVRTSTFITDNDYKQLHWTRQLELRPLGDRQRRVYEQGDFDTRIDMADEDFDNVKEIT